MPRSDTDHDDSATIDLPDPSAGALPSSARSPYGDDAPPARPERQFEPGAIATLLVALCCVAGAVFAGRSTADFAKHLDGQVHAISCSVMPGETAQLGASGCKTAMMSPYSSVMRDQVWGGVPVALPGLALFCFLAAIAFYFTWMPGRSRRESGWLWLATLVPAATSAVFANIAANELGTFCTLCVGIYASSAGAFLFAGAAFFMAQRGEGPLPFGRWLLYCAEGVLAVAAVGYVWMAWVPSERESLKGCGTLVQRKAEPGILVSLPRNEGATPALMVIDPLCPACRAFEVRLEQSGLRPRLGRDLLLFPLDSTCNWMVKTSLHPGACAISEAILCAPAEADKVLGWAFKEQERLLALGKSDEPALRAELSKTFPAVATCLGSADAKAKVNKSLRFAVVNALPVSTPQLYVGDTRLCDEDSDLGLEFALGRLLQTASAQGADIEAEAEAPAATSPAAAALGADAGAAKAGSGADEGAAKAGDAAPKPKANVPGKPKADVPEKPQADVPAKDPAPAKDDAAPGAAQEETP